jgi:AcrR family transcriptional regulator
MTTAGDEMAIRGGRGRARRRGRPGIERGWPCRERRSQGEQPALSCDEIVRVAIEIADAEGAEAVSMRRIATKLGAGAMSLYRHVADKEDLIAQMLDAVFSEIEHPERPSGDWKADLRLISLGTRAVVKRHPWLVPQLGGRPRIGPGFLGHAESTMAAVVGVDADMPVVAAIPAMVDDYVFGFVLRELQEEESARRTGISEGEWWESMMPYLRAMLDTGRYPTIARLIDKQDEDYRELPADERFALGLDCLLDGIAARLAARRSG